MVGAKKRRKEEYDKERDEKLKIKMKE